MSTTSPVGICTSCGAGFAVGTVFCTACGAPVRVEGDGKVLAERVAATPVYGAPPPAPVAAQTPVPLDGVDDEPTPERPPRIDRLPLSLPIPPRRYTPEFAVPEPKKQRLTRRGIVLIAVGLVVVLVLGGLFLRSYLRDRPVHTALDEAGATYGEVIDALGAADDLTGLQEAGRRATTAGAELVESEQRVASREGDLAGAARAVIRAQRGVVAAATGLVGVSEQDLGAWSLAEANLSYAREALVVARDDLARADQGAAEDVVDPAKAIDHARVVVGAEASAQVTGSLDKLVNRLGKAERTAQLRRIAATAGEQAAVVRAAQSGLTGDSAEAVREAGLVFDRLSRLAGLDADHLGVWAATRVDLLAALGSVEGIEAGTVVTHVDEVIDRAVAQMEAWRSDLARAKRKQAKAQSAVAAYETAVRAQLTRYDGLRSQLATFLEQVDAGTVTQPAPVLLQATIDRSTVRAALSAIPTPDDFLAAKQRLEEVLFSAQLVLQQGYDSLADNDCLHTCDYPDYRSSDDYAALQAGSASISTAYANAVAVWSDTLADVKARISDRALPEKPKV